VHSINYFGGILGLVEVGLVCKLEKSKVLVNGSDKVLILACEDKHPYRKIDWSFLPKRPGYPLKGSKPKACSDGFSPFTHLDIITFRTNILFWQARIFFIYLSRF
jgi:hypothetical protein